MSDPQDQGVATPPVTDPAQGAEKQPVTVQPAETVTPKTETTPSAAPQVPQSEWQNMQEQMRETQQILASQKLQNFEKENPIVQKDKYKEKWAELLRLKNTPGHKYAGLDYEDLLRIMREPEVLPPTNNQPSAPVISAPSLNPSVSPDLPAGSMSKEVRDMLSLRYSEDQINSVDKSPAM